MAKKARKPPGRGSDQFVVRLPDGMRDRIATIADQTGRSMNAVILEALTLQLDHLVGDEDVIRALWDRVEALERKVEAHDEKLKNREP